MDIDKAKLKELLVKNLVEKGNYEKLADLVADDDSEKSQELQSLLLKNFVEKGETEQALNFLDKSEKSKSKKEVQNVHKLLAEFSELLTGNTRGVFMKDLVSQVDDHATKTTKKLAKDFERTEKALLRDLTRLVNEKNGDNKRDLLAQLNRSSEKLTATSERLIRELVSREAEDLFERLSEDLRLTDDEKAELVLDAALSVESQMPNLIAEYLKNARLSTEQIDGLRELAQEMISENVPNLSVGGAIHQIAFMRDVSTEGITFIANAVV
jgi:hypothetical protein